MRTICLILKPDADMEAAWQSLEEYGINLLYSSEGPNGEGEIYSHFGSDENQEHLLKQFPFIDQIREAELSIDWEAQWELHGLDFHDGFVHIDLSDFGCKKEHLTHETLLKLKPGPGFGDLSHPTTRLMVQGMSELELQHQFVLDIGCGSGVLSLCAAAMGAYHVDGIDIDPQAIEHAKENAFLNGMAQKTWFGVSEDYQVPANAKSILVLMNMIWSEQIEAWRSVSQLHSIPGDCLISGILSEDRDVYIDLARAWGWKIKNEQEAEGWLCLLFSRDP